MCSAHHSDCLLGTPMPGSGGNAPFPRAAPKTTARRDRIALDQELNVCRISLAGCKIRSSVESMTDSGQPFKEQVAPIGVTGHQVPGAR